MTTHHIETLRLELCHPSPRAALRAGTVQDRFARFLRSEGLQRIAARFDRHALDGQVWQIERLELDLGRLSRHQDEHDWATRLDSALDLALLRLRADTSSPRAPAASRHAIEQFLFYLSNGHLPWGLSLPGRHAVSNWLEHLARTHGMRLWTALQDHPERERMLARLARISPHHGLHALLAQRDAPLAQALQDLEETCLAPLQARGRLGAYQLGQLQQALRAAGLRVLWGARGSALGAGRCPRLLQALRETLARHLGPDWAACLSTAATRPAILAPGSGALRELIAPHALQAADTPHARTPDDLPTRTWEAGLQQLREALSRPRRHGAAHSARVATLLGRLAATHPSALRAHLLQWADERRQRRQWSQCLAPENLGALMLAMGPSIRPGANLPGPGAPQWIDSLRQTALRLQREAPADRRPAPGRLQALLMEACLQRLAEGQRLPDSHSAWQALWQRAWAQWLGESDAEARPARARPATTVADDAAPGPSSRDRRAERDRPAPAAPRASPQAGLDQALRGLEQQCREGRWAWPQRLRLARLLETDGACQRWLQLFDESRRWQMLRAQFGVAAQGLQQRATRLHQWLGAVVHEPVARIKEHWRRLCNYLFVRGLSPAQASLRSHYQAQDPPPATAPRQAPAAHEPIWVDDAGQVLLAPYAERLFKHQGLLHEGRFVDAAAQAVAVQCLQALCHGPGEADEARTALSRLLCGVPAGELLPEVAPLQPATAALLEQLLQAVIAHWKALGHTSVAGLRETFLQREGRLQRDRTPADEPPRWHLRVQTRGFDVLLDRLPWSFQTIRLPWMQGVLHVEWR